MTYADKVKRIALYEEIHRLKSMIPDTENVRRNIEAIERATPMAKMNELGLCDFVNLLHRSIPKDLGVCSND